MIRLVAHGGFEFDLLGSEKIVFTFQNSAPDKIDSFQSDFSTNFNLPNTLRNSAFFEQCFLSTSISTKPYAYINIRVYSNNIEIYPNALLVVKEHNYKFESFESINVFIVSGIVNLKTLIGDKKMVDLETPNIAPSTSFLGTLSTASSFDDDYNRGYIYTLVNRGQFPSSQVPDDLVLPDYYAGKIFETIFENVGVAFEFETEPPQWRKLLISSGEIPKIPISNFINNTKGTAGTTGVVNYVMEFDVENVRFLPITKNTVNNNFNSNGYRPSETALYKIKLRYNARASANVFFAFAGYRLPPVTNTFQFFEVEFFVQLFQFLNQFPLPQHETGGVIADARIHDLIMEVEAVDDARYYSVSLPTNLLLPNIKQWDFIKEMCVRFGLVPSYDLWNKKIVFRIFNNLEFYNVLQDWSDKVDFTQEVNTFFTLENFSKQNFFLNASAEDVELDSAFLLQDNETIEQEKEVFVSSFALPNFDVYGNLINEIPSVPIFQISNSDILDLDVFTAKYTKNKTNFRLMFLPDTKTNFFYAVVSHRRVISSPALVSVSNIFVCKIENLDWQSILTNYYKIYTKMLDKTLRKQVYILLNETDILNLDFLKVVWIKELNGYWYVNKIEQFESADTPVRIELIRIFDVEGITIGNGLRFDGVNDYVSIPCPSNSSLDFEYTDNFSFSVFVKPDLTEGASGSDRGINRLQSGNFVGYDIMFMRFNANTYRIAIAILGGGGFLYVSFDEPFTNVTGQLIHYVFVKQGNNANTFKIYKNGVSLPLTIEANSPQTSSIKSNKPVILNGTVLDPSALNKNEIYDLKAFNKALTQLEVTELFNNKGSQIPISAQSNIVADYGFNQKQGTTLIDTQGNNGTLINFVNTTPGPGNAWVDKNGNSILS